MEPEEILPNKLLEKSKLSGKEYGWKKEDFLSVINSAVQNNLAIIGGQVQFIFDDGVCELYWEKYDSKSKSSLENWNQYVKRSAKECTEQFNKISNEDRLIKEGIDNFDFIKKKSNDKNINLKDHLWFILYFEKEK